jgi:hypothetical protein
MPSSIHYLQPLWAAIYARYLADTATDGILSLVQGFWNIRPPASTITVESDATGVKPYVLYNVASDSSDDTFKESVRLVTVRMAIYVSAYDDDSLNFEDPLVTGSAILDRVVGDWSSQTTRTPAYGFDRWQPTLSGTSWVATQLMHTGTNENHVPGRCYCWILDFDLRVSKASGA